MSDFQYNQAAIEDLKHFMSLPRISKFMALTGQTSEEEAFRLCLINSRLSGAFILPLETLEILLRNRCDTAIGLRYGADWLTNGRLKMVDWQCKEIATQRTRGTTVCAADFCMGFWVQFFGGYYEAKVDLWRPILHKIFTHSTAGFRRQKAHGTFDKVREFRNRIAHHEQIVAKNPAAMLSTIIEAVGWICPTAAAWLAANEEVTPVLDELARLKAERNWSGF